MTDKCITQRFLQSLRHGLVVLKLFLGEGILLGFFAGCQVAEDRLDTMQFPLIVQSVPNLCGSEAQTVHTVSVLYEQEVENGFLLQ
jgi:hypothetical protein